MQCTSIDLPAGTGRAALRTTEAMLPTYLVFQPVGFTKLPHSHEALVSFYLTFSPVPRLSGVVSLSAALSITPLFPMMPLPVRKHGALCCPDFPLPLCSDNDKAERDISMNA